MEKQVNFILFFTKNNPFFPFEDRRNMQETALFFLPKDQAVI